MYQKLFGKTWNPVLTLAMAGVFAGLYFGVTGALWAVTGEFTRWGGNILQLFGAHPEKWAYFKTIKLSHSPLNRVDGLLVIGMFLGSLFSALMSQKFTFRGPGQKGRLFFGIIGGLIAGFGTRLAMGCNLAAFFTGLPQFSLHAWYFIFGTAIGTYVSNKLYRNVRNHRPKLPKVEIRNPQIQSFIGIVVGIVTSVMAIYEFATGKNLLGAALLFGAAFGVLIARGQISFTSALIDFWEAGKGTLLKAIIIGMGIQTVITAILIAHGSNPIIHWASPGALLGGVLFGIGIVLSGTCETGWIFHSMEGQLYYVAVGIGNIVGATMLAYGWDHWGIYNSMVKGYPNFNLITSWGWSGALLFTFGGLLALYLLVRAYETKRAKKTQDEHVVMSVST